MALAANRPDVLDCGDTLSIRETGRMDCLETLASGRHPRRCIRRIFWTGIESDSGLRRAAMNLVYDGLKELQTRWRDPNAASNYHAIIGALPELLCYRSGRSSVRLNQA
jgi:hypothetical protein